jgi:hypothetical protein
VASAQLKRWQPHYQRLLSGFEFQRASVALGSVLADQALGEAVTKATLIKSTGDKLRALIR